MQLVHVYVNLPGNGAEAFHFYETVFGTRIVMAQTFGDTLFAANAPAAARSELMHVQLPITEAVHLMGATRRSSRPAISRRSCRPGYWRRARIRA